GRGGGHFDGALAALCARFLCLSSKRACVTDTRSALANVLGGCAILDGIGRGRNPFDRAAFVGSASGGRVVAVAKKASDPGAGVLLDCRRPELCPDTADRFQLDALLDCLARAGV